MKMEEELVSIIMPAYNSVRYIGEAIESVIAQTYKNWEMIIVDDCSTDGTRRTVQKYLKDTRIQYVCLTVNSGGARARNHALRIAKGQFIAFLDADDQWKPLKLSKQIAFMQRNHYGFTFTSYEIMNKDKMKIVTVPEVLNYSAFMKNTIIGTLTVIINQSIIGPVRLVDIRKDHDSMTWAAILKKGNKAYGLDESLALYRKVTGSISNNKFRAVKRHWKNCRTIEQIPFFKCVYYFIFYIKNAIKKHYC